MTTNIERGKAFRGIPVTKLREVLKAWRLGARDVDGIASLSKAPDDRRQVLGLLQEAADIGLLGMVVDREASMFRPSGTVKPDMDLTETGLAVANASAAKRMEKTKAQELFNGLLKNAATVNVDPNAPVSVKEIWLFGSMLDEQKKDVGDIDFVVVTERTKAVPDMTDDWHKRLVRHMRTHYPHMLPKNWDPYRQFAEDLFVARSLYGKRRHHMFSPNDMVILKKLHRPCRLVFDSSRGGPVEDPVLPHHPESKERSKTINPRLKMPDLTQVPAAFRPTSVGWLADYDGRYRKRPTLIGDVSYGFDPSYDPAQDTSRDAFELRFGETGRDCVVRVSRSMQDIDDVWTYACIVEVVSDKAKRGLSQDDVAQLGELLDELVGADAFRMAARRHDLGSTAMIEIDMQVRADGLSGLYDGLHDRAYRAGFSTVMDDRVLPEEFRFSLEAQIEGDESVGYLSPEELAEMEEDEWLPGTSAPS